MIKNVALEALNSMMGDSVSAYLGLHFVEIGSHHLVMEMPVTSKAHQPMGLLHGGVSAYIIETIASVGSSLIVNLSEASPVGLEINANHIKGMRTGILQAKASIIHAGRRTHLWQVELRNKETQDLICTGRLTVMIITN
jgi:1,4-dihydroxy-2-naphthoyl-CoA hydrolase